MGLNEGDCHLDQCTATLNSSLPNSVAGTQSDLGAEGRER